MLYSQQLIDKIENAYYSALRRSKDQNVAEWYVNTAYKALELIEKESIK